MNKKRKGSRKKKKLNSRQKIMRSLSLALCIICSFCIFVPTGKVDDESARAVKKEEPPFLMSELLDYPKEQLVRLSDKPKLRCGAFAIEPATGRFIDLAGKDRFAAASMIKVPVLVKLLQAIDRNEVSMDEVLVLRPDLIGGGSGFLQWRPPNSRVSLKEAMETMIIFSDNTATNLIIDRLGGKEVCNRDFALWGLKDTYINDWLPDLPGTNKTSPYELVHLLAKVDNGDLLSEESRKKMLAIMEKTRIKTLLPAGLPQGAKISHKTGDIGSLVGDCGIITCPDGRRYIACVQVERPHNDRRANELIRQVSKVIYSGMVSAPNADEQSRSLAARRSKNF